LLYHACSPTEHRVQYERYKCISLPIFQKEEAKQEAYSISMAASSAVQCEKKIVALSSVGAAIGLTCLKIVVALLTGSLGMQAEAAHSGLDLIAALMTFLAVRVADRPADATHNYGHGKVENLSAFLESGLLLLTAAWVITEALQRLLSGGGHIEVSIWAFIVMTISIIVDATRSRALLRVARKLGSQALEADALHFSTDIWSSAVVIGGLLIVSLTKLLHLPDRFALADAVAALGVSAIVIWVSLRLAKETIDALLDRSPSELLMCMRTCIERIAGVTELRRMRIRRVGNKFFTDIIIAAPRTLSFEQIHELSNAIEHEAREAVHTAFEQGDVDIVVHIEPIASPTETVIDQIHYLAERQGVHAHDIHIREVGDKLEADFDVEVQGDMNLENAHSVATQLEQAILASNRRLCRVTTHLEAPNNSIVPRQDVTQHYPAMARDICRIADSIAGSGSAHDVHLYRPRLASTNLRTQGPFSERETQKQSGIPSERLVPLGPAWELDRGPSYPHTYCYQDTTQGKDRLSSISELDLVLHTIFDAHTPLSQVHVDAEEIKRALRMAYPNLGLVTIHTEPPDVPDCYT
jgi:cation diffusion facilitator family transporter